jgi:hypothetical protein
MNKKIRLNSNNIFIIHEAQLDTPRNIMIHRQEILQKWIRTNFQIVKRIAMLESKILIEKPKISKIELVTNSKKYFDELDKMNYQIQKEVKEEMMTNGTYYENPNLEMNNTIHYSKSN